MELNRDNYFSREAEALYMGSSSFKAWDILHGGCEAREVAKTKGEWTESENDAFLLGSYVHAWSEGRLKEFIDENPQMFTKKGTIYEKYAVGDKMIEVLKNDPLVERFRDGAEKEKIFTGKIGGVDFKIQVDILNLDKNYFADIKTTKSLSETYYNENERCRESFIDKYDYKLQIAIYAEVLRQNLGLAEYLEPYLIVVDKNKNAPDHEIIDMGTDFIEEKIKEIEGRLSRIMAVRNGVEQPVGCGKCDYCRSKKKAEIITYSKYLEGLGL